MATASEYIDILLLGKTGMGKSTTGNILLGLNNDGSIQSGGSMANDLFEWSCPDQLESQSTHPVANACSPLDAQDCSTSTTYKKSKPCSVNKQDECRGPTFQHPREHCVETWAANTFAGGKSVNAENVNTSTTSSANVSSSTPGSAEWESKSHFVEESESKLPEPPHSEQHELSSSKQPPDFPGGGETAQKPKHFPIGETALSETSVPKVVSNKQSKIRVLDTPGFAHSGSSLPVIQANLELICQIARLQKAFQFNFHYVLYFLPCRGSPQRADRVLKDEIAVMHHYFGVRLWQHLVFVLTAPSEYQDETMASLLTEGRLKKNADRIITVALQDIWNINKETSTFQPANLIYISLSDTSATIMNKVRSAISTEVDGGLQLRPKMCIKCNADIILDCDSKIGTGSSTPESNPASMCHPRFQNTFPRKLFQYWEVCVHCGKRNGTNGCLPVGRKYKDYVVTHETLLLL